MSRSQLLIASRLLKMAADQFSNHGCNDIPRDLFAGVSQQELDELEITANAINRSANDPISLVRFGDSGLMAILADILDRAAGGAR